MVLSLIIVLLKVYCCFFVLRIFINLNDLFSKKRETAQFFLTWKKKERVKKIPEVRERKKVRENIKAYVGISKVIEPPYDLQTSCLLTTPMHFTFKQPGRKQT